MIQNEDGDSEADRIPALQPATPSGPRVPAQPAGHPKLQTSVQFVISALVATVFAMLGGWLMYVQTHQVVVGLLFGAATFAGVLDRTWTILRRFVDQRE
ncbi:hypothetical protein EV385_4564 [Krasilnikovia cinnamomea]|uniref:Uncharacterized protein n=1 Tax=Krasilnikovia cinnamomea TaxID=349313 RepID=A0A4Q7ZPM9_9ACTN|nr:hypothetical protein [Krasilnikovia cinnamomea]RZU52684.1 hypothetical protein EV385_4564 [Krasilnikovia cinnamomea]